MGERLTPKGRRLLEQEKVDLNKKSKEATFVYGKAAGFRDGDGYHDETANLLESEVRKTRALLSVFISLLNSAEELKPPKQFDRVDLGHRVGVELPDDKDVNGVAHVTILSSGDVRVLSEEFDQISEILVSDKSPLGSALLGKKVGDEAKYGNNRALVKSIGKANVFEDD